MRSLLLGSVRVRGCRTGGSPCSIRHAPCLIIQLRFPVPVLLTTSLSVAYGEGRWGTLLCEDSRWLGEASDLNRQHYVRRRERALGETVVMWALLGGGGMAVRGAGAVSCLVAVLVPFALL